MINDGCIGAAIIVIVAFAGWTRHVLTTAALGCRRAERWPLLVMPALGLAALFVVLARWADPDIWKENGSLIVVFVASGLAWMLIPVHAFAWLNVSLHRDALAGRNPAAVWTCAGALLAVELTFAGGNIGTGSEVTTFLSAALATGMLFVLWLAIEMISHISVAITVERDVGSGVRLAGLLVALGLILGRAVAGDWVSIHDTLRDFIRDGWTADALALGAAVVDRRLQPTGRAPVRTTLVAGVLPALAYVAVAGSWLAHLGSWK